MPSGKKACVGAVLLPLDGSSRSGPSSRPPTAIRPTTETVEGNLRSASAVAHLLSPSHQRPAARGSQCTRGPRPLLGELAQSRPGDR